MSDLDDILALGTSSLRDWRGMSFLEFGREIDVTQTPGQLALSLVVFDRLQPVELPAQLKEYARKIFGPVERFPDECRKVVVLVIGGRSGKSYVFSALRAVHMAVSIPLSVNANAQDGLAPGEKAYATIVAPEPEQREQCFGYVLGAIRANADLTAMAVAAGAKLGPDGKLDQSVFESAQAIDLKRADGFTVCIRTIPAKRGGGALRGAWHVFCALEEAAFFRDANNVVNDADLFAAVAPRVLPGGQLLLSSTPWTESGVLYEEFVANHPDPSCAAPHLKDPGVPHRAIAAHAPTLLMRDTPMMRQSVANETRRDPDNAAREFGAQFLAKLGLMMFDPAHIAGCVDRTLEYVHDFTPSEDMLCAAGIDAGMRHDAASCVPLSRDASGYVVRHILQVFAAREGLKASQVTQQLVDAAIEQGCSAVVGDLWGADFIREKVEDAGLSWFEFSGSDGKSKFLAYDALRRLLSERKIRLPNHPELLRQMRECRKKPQPGGGVAVEVPRNNGGHGDILSALVHGVWWLSTQSLPEVEQPQTYGDSHFRQAIRELDGQSRRGAWESIAGRIGRR